MAFQKATKERAKLRLALIGPAGSGKTYTALNIANNLGKKIAVIDTERGSASLYSDKFDFDVLELQTFEPEGYIAGIRDAAESGYDVLIIDSLSHAWSGKGGILEFVDNAARRSGGGNSFGAWRDATPKHNALVEAILAVPVHVIVTMRSKMEYVQEKDAKTGKTTVRKVGLQPIQREGLEYEFTVTADLDIEHNMIISKTRCETITDKVFNRAGKDVAQTLLDWLNTGSEPTPKASAPQETLGDATAPVPTLGEAVTEAARNPIGNPPLPRHVRPDWMKKAALKAQEAGLRLKDIPALKLHESATSTDVENALVAWRIAISEGQPKAGDVWVLEQFDRAIEEAKVPEGVPA